LRDVARAVGVSHVAISLALRGDARISEKRRAEIKLAAERLGYRPDPMLSSLAAYRRTKQSVRGIPRFCRRILVEGQWIDGTSLPPRSGAESSVAV